MTRKYCRCFLVAVPALLLGATGWTLYHQVCQARLDADLVAAVNQNDLARVNALLDRGADANALPQSRPASAWQGVLDTLLGRKRPAKTPLLVTAVLNEQWSLVRALASYNADVSVLVSPPSDGWPTTVLGRAIYDSQSPETIRVLLDHGGSPSASDTMPDLEVPAVPYPGGRRRSLSQSAHQDRFTMLHIAAMFDEGAMTRLLLERGAPVNAVDAYGRTPLMLAAGYRNLPFLQLLLAHGADVQFRDQHQETALHYAVSTRFLGRIGANYASYGRETCAVLRVLLAQGADPTAREGNGQTPRRMDVSDWRLPGVSALLREAEIRWQRKPSSGPVSRP